MLQTIVVALRWVHIPAGLIGLAVFWLPLVVKKGGRLHRRAGWLFVVCMGLASVTAAGLAVVRLLIAADSPGGLTFAASLGPIFLFNVAMLSGVSVHHGVAILRQKGRQAPHRGVVDIALPAALLSVSLASVAIGIATGFVLLFTLPVVGVLVSAQQLWVLLRTPSDRMFWWFQHMSGMLGGCIAALTAALITNAATLRPYVPAPSWVYWIAPSAIGVPLLLIWQGVYRRRFGSKPVGVGNAAPAPKRA